MPIPAPTPIVKPAVAEAVFDSLRIRNFQVRAPHHAEGTVYIETIPENSQTMATDQGSPVDDIREPLYEILANVPEAAAVFDAFISGMATALPAIRSYIATRDAQEGAG